MNTPELLLRYPWHTGWRFFHIAQEPDGYRLRIADEHGDVLPEYGVIDVAVTLQEAIDKADSHVGTMTLLYG